MAISNHRLTIYYWLISLVGFLLSLAVFTKTVQQCEYDFLWLPITLGLSASGCVVVLLADRQLKAQAILSHSRLLFAGIAGYVVFGLALYASFYLGYLMFLVFYAFWLTISIALIYYGIRLFSSSKG